MALFKILKGKSKNLPINTTEGYVYFTTDKGNLFIDTATSDGTASARTMVSGLPYIVGESKMDGDWIANHPGLSLRDGLCILYVPNTNGSNVSDRIIPPTEDGIWGETNAEYTCLNLNSLGWKPCFYSSKRHLKDEYAAGTPILLVYQKKLNNGQGGWQSLSSYSSNEVNKEQINFEARFSGSQIDKYKICALDVNNKLQPLTFGATKDEKVVNTVSIRPDYFYFYNDVLSIGTNELVNADVLSSSYLIEEANYTFNSIVPANHSVYLCGDLKEDGMFTLDATDPNSFYLFVPNNGVIDYNSLFKTNKYYIYLGSSSNESNKVYLREHHSLYYFDGTNLIQATSFALNAKMIDGHSVETEITDEESDNIPTSKAVVGYVKSLSYNGIYD